MTSLYLKPFFEHNLSSLSFLVTGGGGFIGSHIAEYLLLHGAKRVRVIDDFSTGFRSNIEPFLTHPAFELLEGDLRHYPTCYQACADIDIVCHQAAIGSVPRSIQNPDYTTSVNVDGFVNLVKAAKEQGIKRVVYASSSSVYGSEPTLPKIEERIGKPLSPYAVSKYAAELYAGVFAQVYGIDFIGLRYFNVFGPRQSPKGAYAAVIPLFIDGLLRQEPVYINGKGDQTRDFTFITNVVQVNMRAMLTTNPDALNQVYNVAVGERFSVLALYQMLSEILQSNLQPVFRASRSGDIEHSLADISKAQQLLQYRPLVKFKEGLQITVSCVNG